jgi:hypothetical protein
MNIKDLDKQVGHDDLKDWKTNMRLIMKHGYENVMELFIKKLISQSNQEIVEEILDRVDKEVIENIPRYLKGGKLITQYFAKGWNECKEEQRQKLTQLRQSNNLLIKKIAVNIMEQPKLEFKKNMTKAIEVIRILPAYQTVSKKRKLRALDLIEKWINDEREKLQSNNLLGKQK